MFVAHGGLGDTIVAAATPRGPAVRAIVRVSGPRALPVAASAFEGSVRAALAAAPGGTRIAAALALDDVRVPAAAWIFRTPRSYTGEDLVEVHTLGAPALVDRLVAALASAGARPARPGEFTRRAFEMGRIDLTAAEAVLALSSAASDAAARAALRQLRGGLRREVEALRETVLDVLAEIEVAIDFAHEDLARELAPRARLFERLAAARASIDRILSREAGRAAPASGRPAALLYGPPNAGKSSLFNALAGSERALVSPRAGTTRDALVAAVEGVDLIDAPGVAPTEPSGGASGAAIEASGGAGAAAIEAQARAERLLDAADAVLVVLDGSEPLAGPAERALARTRGRRRTVVLQKSDLPRRIDPGALALDPGEHPLLVSAATGAGLGSLRALLRAMAGEPSRGEDGVAVAPNERHRAALGAAARALDAALAALAASAPAELAAIDLRAAADALAEVTGAACAEDVLDRIFARFCIGK